MSSPYARDLEKWIPHLLSVWRAARAGKGGGKPGKHGAGGNLPPDTLTPQELREVGAAVKKLSHGLTRERELAGARYMDDAQLLGAYLLFYWPVSYAQARQALGELPRRPRSVLDLGSGPGPLAFAAMDAGASEVICADRSKPALDLATSLAREAGEAMATRTWDPSKSSELPEGEFDLILMGHVVNELYGRPPEAIAPRTALLEKVLAKVKKGGSLLVIEPALRETSRALLQVRDALVAKGYALRAPCLFQSTCPALVKESDWCHAEREWEPPKLVLDIGRAATLNKEALKMTYLAFAPLGEAWPTLPEGRHFRIVSERLEGKGRHRYIGCGPEGRTGLALQEKHRNKENAAFFYAHRGDVFRVSNTTEKGDGFGMDDQSEVKLVAPAGKPLPLPE